MAIPPAVPPHPSTPGAAVSGRSNALYLKPQWGVKGEQFRHTWEGVINVDQFRWFVRRDLQEQLGMAREELGAQHVRAVGMYDDEMRVFCPSPASFMGYEPKQPRTNWQIVDYVMDAIVDRGLSPMFTTSFIPSAMASGSTKVFTTQASTSPPKDWKQWETFVRESVQHMIDRYSLAVVRQWYFEVWNEPNLSGWFWGGNQDDFFRLWQVTYGAIKSVDGNLRVGGPSCAHAAWMEELVNFGAQQDCAPDYLITHMYNNDGTMKKALAPFEGAQIDKNNQSPNAAIGVMRGMRRLVDRIGFKGELHWNEWGRSFHGIDPRRETPSEAAFVVRLLAEVSQEADSFAYWCLSDIYDQVGYGREAFHGGYGLLSLQGLRKPTYHAFQLLQKLGTERIKLEGEGIDSFNNAIVTSSGPNAWQVLVYGYDHADEPVRQLLRLAVDLPPGSRPRALYRIDTSENNVVSQWRELGSPAYLSRGQTKELRATNGLQRSSTPIRLVHAEGQTTAHFTMEAPGVALLEIEREGNPP